jgi:hypothetical protein
MAGRVLPAGAVLALLGVRLFAAVAQGGEGDDGAPRVTAAADVVVTAKKPPASLDDVTDSSESLIGVADAASQGIVGVRQLDARPLVEDGSVRASSSTLVNLEIGREIIRGVRLALDLFNVLDSKAADVDYYYASRLPGEPAGGVDDIHTHPVSPRSTRLAVLYSF